MDQNPQEQSKIRHTQGLGQAPASPPPSSPNAPASAGPTPPDGPLKVTPGGNGERKEIRAFGANRSRHEDSWTRTPNTTGNGAIHVKTFHGKLSEDALHYMDQQINEWLDAHPQYEVKFVTSAIGTFTGKIKEPHIISQVWV